MQKLKALINELTGMFEELNGVEDKKKEAILKDRPTEVEDCMKQEQVLTLRFKSCEKKVEEMLKQAGEEDKTLKDLLDQLSPEEREELLPLYERLQSSVLSYRELNNTVADLLKVRLHSVEKKIEQAGIYTSSGGHKTSDSDGRVRRV